MYILIYFLQITALTMFLLPNALIKSTEANESANIFTRLCISRFKNEMKNAGVKPPKGMDGFTCKCFLTEFNQGLSINSALSKCKKKATKKFMLVYSSI